jgi:uncharacterized membrane protein (UPF0136 family)
MSGCALPLAVLLAVTLGYFAEKDAVWFAAVAGLLVGTVLAVTGSFLRRTTDPPKHSLGLILIFAGALILAATLVVDVMHLRSAVFCGLSCG